MSDDSFLPPVSGTASGLLPRPARCGASASLRAVGLRSPEEFQNAPRIGSLKFFGPPRKKRPLGLGAAPTRSRVPRYTGQKGSKTCIRIVSLSLSLSSDSAEGSPNERRRRLYSPVARNQDFLEERQGRVGVTHGVAPDHRLVETRRIRADALERRSRTSRGRNAQPRI